jgi:hypothetical protein
MTWRAPYFDLPSSLVPQLVTWDPETGEFTSVEDAILRYIVVRDKHFATPKNLSAAQEYEVQNAYAAQAGRTPTYGSSG